MKIKMDLVNWKKFGRVLVCIDAANLENSAKGLGWWIDYEKLYHKETRVSRYCSSLPAGRQAPARTKT